MSVMPSSSRGVWCQCLVNHKGLLLSLLCCQTGVAQQQGTWALPWVQGALDAAAAAAAAKDTTRHAQQQQQLHLAALNYQARQGFAERRLQAAAAKRQAQQQAKEAALQTRLAAAAAVAPAAVTADAWGIDGAKLEQLLLPPLHGLPSYTQLEDPMPAYIKAASDYRACIDARVQTGEAVCCVCARYLPLVTKDKGAVLPKARDPCHKGWHEVPDADIPGKQVLVTAEYLGNDANGVAIPRHTPELPRVGLTTYTIGNIAYCLEPAGIVNTNGEPCCPHNTLKWSHLLVCR